MLISSGGKLRISKNIAATHTCFHFSSKNMSPLLTTPMASHDETAPRDLKRNE